MRLFVRVATIAGLLFLISGSAGRMNLRRLRLFPGLPLFSKSRIRFRHQATARAAARFGKRRADQDARGLAETAPGPAPPMARSFSAACPMPAGVKLKVLSHENIDGGTRELLEYDSEHGWRVQGYLLRPTGEATLVPVQRSSRCIQQRISRLTTSRVLLVRQKSFTGLGS